MSRVHIHNPKNIGDKIADVITWFVGSWYCVGFHTLWFVVWFAFRLDINTLTLIVSLEAIYLCTLLMKSQNRQVEKDRARDDIEAVEVDELYQINKQQLTELDKLNQIEDRLSDIDVLLTEVMNRLPSTRRKAS